MKNYVYHKREKETIQVKNVSPPNARYTQLTHEQFACRTNEND